MPKKHYLTIAAAALLGITGFSSMAMAGTEEASGKEVKNPVPTEPAPNYITGDFGVTFVSEYISRGIVLNSKSVIAEPYLDIYVKAYDDPNGFISSVSAQISLWSDITDQPTGYTNNTVRDWYEFDYDPGISIVFAKNFTLLVSYFEFDSPDGGFLTARSVNATLTYDDSGFMGAFALHPHFTVLYELGAPGFAGLLSKAWYFEPGIAPSYTFLPKSTYPITVSLPVTAGLGDHRFYNGNPFGYISVGPMISVPLAFIPAGYGSWTFTAGYTYYYLGSTTKTAVVAGNHANQNVFSGAIGCTF